MGTRTTELLSIFPLLHPTLIIILENQTGPPTVFQRNNGFGIRTKIPEMGDTIFRKWSMIRMKGARGEEMYRKALSLLMYRV